jgi:hypothetical protein
MMWFEPLGEIGAFLAGLSALFTVVGFGLKKIQKVGTFSTKPLKSFNYGQSSFSTQSCFLRSA